MPVSETNTDTFIIRASIVDNCFYSKKCCTFKSMPCCLVDGIDFHIKAIQLSLSNHQCGGFAVLRNDCTSAACDCLSYVSVRPTSHFPKQFSKAHYSL